MKRIYLKPFARIILDEESLLAGSLATGGDGRCVIDNGDTPGAGGETSGEGEERSKENDFEWDFGW